MKPVAIFRHFPTEGPAYLGDYLTSRQIPWQLIPLDQGAPVPAASRNYAGLVFMGGPMSVNDDLPWISPVLQLIRDAMAHTVPVLGHCLGSQLMSKALGGQVTRAACKEIGWGKIEVADTTEARHWFDEWRTFEGFHWHGETWSLPQGAALIAGSSVCPHQAFVLGPHLGMQFHVEMTEPVIRAWCETGRREIESSNSPAVQPVDAILEHMPAKLPQLNRVAETLYRRWTENFTQ